jgi:hypothetical protein
MAPKIVCCWNSEIRNNGTARRVWDTLVRMGLKEHGMVRYNRPPYGEVKWNDYDFLLFVDDGRDEIPMELPDIPKCGWLIDTHLGYDVRLSWAKQFDQVFLCHKPDVKKMQADGIKRVEWLPMACHPPVDPTARELVEMNAVKSLDELVQLWDLCFVGFLHDDKEGNSRLDYLDAVFGAFPNSWFALRRFFTEAAARYAKAKVGFNVSIRDDLNMRFFEVLSYGSCLVTNRDVAGWEDLGFRDMEHFVGYQGIEEAIAKIRWCLEHPVERVEIAKAGHRLVRAEHTYEHRVQQILKAMTA